MATTTTKQNALNIFIDGDTANVKDYLKEAYAGTIKNVMDKTLSTQLKNMELSGDPAGGSVTARRFANAEVKAYGTARTAGKGDALKDKPVTIFINQDKEIVEEFEEKDIKLSGFEEVFNRRKISHVGSMVRDLETDFFKEAATAAEIEYTPGDSETTAKSIDKMILNLKKVKNDFVNGVPVELMTLVLSPEKYSDIREYLDTSVNNANIDTSGNPIHYYHGVRVEESIYLPTITENSKTYDVNAILYTQGSVAQPVFNKQEGYGVEQIPLSNAKAVTLYYSYGTKAVTPDLIEVWKTEQA